MIPLILLLAGCPATVQFPPDLWVWNEDTGWWDTGGDNPEGLAIGNVDWGCDLSQDYWVMNLRTTRWTGGASLHLFGPTGWSEEHPTLLVDSDPNGNWDVYLAGPLADATPLEAYVSGSTSVFDCETDADHLLVVIPVEDRFGDVVDCVMWGEDATRADTLLQDPQIEAIGGCRWLEDM